MRGPIHQVVALLPGKRCEIELEFYIGFEIMDADVHQALEDFLPGLIS